MRKYNDVQTTLSTPLDPKFVKKHPYTGFDYIEGCTAIDNANAAFGYDGWSVDVDTEHMKFMNLPATGNGTKRGVVTVPVIVSVIVEKDGEAEDYTEVVKTDIGSCIWNGEDQIETAIKGAVTDGMKRALRMFGPQFGNDLYKKEEVAAVSQTAESYAQKEQRVMQENNMNPEQVAPSCDKCGSKMKLRNGPRGAFWGCGDYPNCKNIINVDEVDINGNRVGANAQQNTVPQQQTGAHPAQNNSNVAEDEQDVAEKLKSVPF